MTQKMAVIVPTRGRRENIIRLGEAWHKTGAGCGQVESAQLWLVVDDDDVDTYRHVDEFLMAKFDLSVRLLVVPAVSMNAALNAVAPLAAAEHPYVGFMGDDHVPRTPFWVSRMIDVLHEGPCRIAYGDDLMQGVNLPTAVFMTSDIIRKLGYMAPPRFRHLYLDNTWKTWGERLGTLAYVPEVVIEHMHFQVGKSECDEGYVRVNSGDTWAHDEGMWKIYEAGPDGLESDVAKLREAMGATVPQEAG